jgi:hypothetical protein
MNNKLTNIININLTFNPKKLCNGCEDMSIISKIEKKIKIFFIIKLLLIKMF